MENKKGVPNNSENVQNEAPQNHTPLEQLRLFQYGLKMNHQHQSHPHQQLNSPLHLHMHQYQKPQPLNRTNYQTNYVHQHQPHPPNQMLQNTPQIWMPHQPPVHYHHQQQLQKKSVQLPVIPVVKPKETLERKKSNSQMRSPSAKRPPGAPVTIQGWLYKQGSEGLMLWKKRWFVLSEYCLFYYKSSEEEKMLGSILLPSYKVSICNTEDKVNKKFAFKCEHANMRTYILAAHSQELMLQWIRVLNLACLLQSNLENEQQISSVTNESDRDYNHTPIHMHSSSNTTELSNPSQEISQYTHQPLYANAPPKPRRLNDGSYTSSSPEVLERYNNQDVPMIRNVIKSPMNIYNHIHVKSQSPQPEYVHHRPRNDLPEYMYSPNVPQNVERRTPDTYGRSKLNTKRLPTDYEDIYAERMYKRPLSPIAYSHVRKTIPVVNAQYRAYTPPNLIDKDPPNYLRKSPNQVIRPHSADFLEYELNHRRPNPNVLTKQQPRPKSSLDINRYSNNDNYFYSEERYAEKMRKSAQYLPNMPKYYTHQPTQNSENFSLMRSNTQPIDFNLPVTEVQPIRSRSVLSEGSLSRELDVDMQSYRREPVSPAFQQRPEYAYSNEEEIRNREQFIRSASARMSNQNDLQTGMNSMTIVGDRKREESMKRLLEWKQRMLQSPLNRKVQNHRVFSGTPPQMYGKSHEMDVVSKVDGNMYCSDGRRSVNTMPQYNSYSSDDEASGSIQINTRFPKSIATNRMWNSNTPVIQSRSVTNLSRNNDIENYTTPQEYYQTNHPDISMENIHSHSVRKEKYPLNDKMNVSAGELLGRTHEELVLLLIQLRRQNSNTLQAVENCYNEIDTLQAQLHGSVLNQAKRLENLQKLEQIKQHLIELEKQYEKGKPLVNLVDNMVKLGSLYRTPHERNFLAPDVRDRLEFNQQIQERRLLAEERRDWNRLNFNHSQLQEKVQQLYKLDKLIQEESGTLQTLQQDKEDIEKALGGLKHRLNKGFSDPAEIEEARKQQVNLENELSRVHLMLAQNSKKLEETVAGNARLEQELLILKQKLQISRQQRSSPQFSNAGDSLPCAAGTSAMLESDLQRVQQKVGDLQKQRQELCLQVRQLTDRSNSLQQQVRNVPTSLQNQSNKKRINSYWRETDLDTMNIIDHGDSWDNAVFNDSPGPLYINTKQNDDRIKSNDSDDTSQNSNLAMSHEKPEIKTVRIVKRESERRQRDREKSATGKWDALLEEETSSQNSSILFRPTPVQKTQSTINVMSPNYESTDKNIGILSRQSSISSPSLPQSISDCAVSSESERSPELSPIFKSEAARQIITEMCQDPPQNVNRRAIPKEKRRHYTAPHNNLIMKSLNHLPTDEDNFDKLNLNDRRARDDLDMERALRQRIDAPDVVRSTLSCKELKYNENTIDNILGTPNKISIPERYIPEQLPQLSAEEQEHRLRKVESIKKMLSDSTIISTSSSNLVTDEKLNKTPSTIPNTATSKMIEEKKQREHLLQLNQILAKQVMEMSKIVAGTNLSDDQ